MRSLLTESEETSYMRRISGAWSSICDHSGTRREKSLGSVIAREPSGPVVI